MKTFIVVFTSATLLSVLITPMVIRFARYMDIVDRPDARKVHRSVIPRIGGVAIFLSMVFAVVPVLALNNDIGAAFQKIQRPILGLFLAGTLVFFIGLVDDVIDVRARVKLLGQLVGAVVLGVLGVRIEEIEIAEQLTVTFGVLSWPITIFWIIGITNAVNLIDGLDGLAAGLGAITCGVIAVFAIHTGQPVMAVLMLALLGSLVGFLFFNFNPAKIFMGDCGSLFLGFTLASVSVMCVAKTATLVAIALPILAMGIPIFDTLFSMLRRTLERRSLFAPDQDHIHHRLLARGLDQRRTVLVIYLMAIVVAGLGLYMLGLRGLSPIGVFLFASVLLLSLFRSVGAVRLGDSLMILKRNLEISRGAKEEKRTFETLQLRLRRAQSFQEWWRSVCEAAEKMGFVGVSLATTHRDGTPEILAWNSPHAPTESTDVMKMKVPIQDRRSNEMLTIEITVRITGSLESAGHRAALFVRLMDEYGLPRLKFPPPRPVVEMG